MFVKLAVIACSLATTLAAYNGPLAGGLPAAQFPAGINPQSCPNYPDCSNPLVAIDQGTPQQYQAQPQYQPAPQQYQPAPQQYQPALQYQSAPRYSQPQPQPQAQQPSQISQYNPVLPQQYAPTSRAQYPDHVQQALDRGDYIGDGDYHGEGLAEALAPGHTAAPAAPQYAPQQYSAAPAPTQYNAAPYNQAAAAPTYNTASAHATPAQIPAGVNAQACPNYPFCH